MRLRKIGTPLIEYELHQPLAVRLKHIHCVFTTDITIRGVAVFEEAENITFKVVIHHEQQYSIWPDNRENAPGWRDAGCSGGRQQCLEFIESKWADMRPASLRNAQALPESTTALKNAGLEKFGLD